jgi:hypothetical protein
MGLADQIGGWLKRDHVQCPSGTQKSWNTEFRILKNLSQGAAPVNDLARLRALGDPLQSPLQSPIGAENSLLA